MVLANNYVALRSIFAHLHDYASLEACAAVLPRGTNWGEAAAAVAAERGRRAAPKIFCFVEKLDGWEEQLYDRMKMNLDEFNDNLSFRPAMAINSSLLLSRVIHAIPPMLRCPVFNIPGISVVLGVEDNVCPMSSRLRPSPKHSALFIPNKEDASVIPFELSKKYAASGRPLLPVLMGSRFDRESKCIKCVLIFIRYETGKDGSGLSGQFMPRAALRCKGALEKSKQPFSSLRLRQALFPPLR